MSIVYVYVCRHKYIFCFAFSCLQVFFIFGLDSLCLHLHTRARVQVDGIDTEKNDVEERTYGKGRCIQK